MDSLFIQILIITIFTSCAVSYVVWLLSRDRFKVGDVLHESDLEPWEVCRQHFRVKAVGKNYYLLEVINLTGESIDDGPCHKKLKSTTEALYERVEI